MSTLLIILSSQGRLVLNIEVVDIGAAVVDLADVGGRLRFIRLGELLLLQLGSLSKLLSICQTVHKPLLLLASSGRRLFVQKLLILLSEVFDQILSVEVFDHL